MPERLPIGCRWSLVVFASESDATLRWLRFLQHLLEYLRDRPDLVVVKLHSFRQLRFFFAIRSAYRIVAIRGTQQGTASPKTPKQWHTDDTGCKWRQCPIRHLIANHCEILSILPFSLRWRRLCLRGSLRHVRITDQSQNGQVEAIST